MTTGHSGVFAMPKLRVPGLNVTDAERDELLSLVSRRRTAQGLAFRARIVLACAEGVQNKEVAAQLDVDPNTIGKWRRRFLEQRIDGLRDAPRSGAPRTIGDEQVEAVITRTLESVPKAATHWSSRGMAEASGLSVSAHKTQLTRNWLAKRPRWHVHLTPTSASWINQVERVFGLLTDRQIRRGVPSIGDGPTGCDSQLHQSHTNAAPRPFRWTKTADDILASIERFCLRIPPLLTPDQPNSGSGH